MSFEQEIKEMLGLDKSISDIYVYVVVSKGAVVQGYKRLLEISDTRLIVLGKNKRKLQICGNNLEIFSLAPSEIVVHGKITMIGEFNE